MNGYETLTLEHFDRSQDHDQLAMLLRLQREEPLYLHQGFWVLTRYADVNAGLRDERLINRAARTVPQASALRASTQGADQSIS